MQEWQIGRGEEDIQVGEFGNVGCGVENDEDK